MKTDQTPKTNLYGALSPRTKMRVPARDLAFIAKIMTDVSLPTKRTELNFWERENGNLWIGISAGIIHVLENGQKKTVSFVPYGKYARAIMKHLVEEAKKGGSGTVDLGETTLALLKQLGLTKGGTTYRDVFNQLQSVLAMNIKITSQEIVKDPETGAETYDVSEVNVRVSDYQSFTMDVRTGELVNQDEPGNNYVKLSPEFMEVFVSNAVPIRSSDWDALLKGTKSPIALDVYSWLWARGNRWKKNTPIGWDSLHKQFGSTTQDMREFRKTFKKAVADVYEHTNIAVRLSYVGEGKRTGFRGVLISPVSTGKGYVDSVPDV